MKNNLYKQIFMFLVVGVIATIIDWIVYYISCNILQIIPYISNIISFSISVIFNYVASAKWVFNFKKNTFLNFIIFSILGLLLTELFLYIFIDLLDLDTMLSKVIATCITMVFNFVTRKIIMEKKVK